MIVKVELWQADHVFETSKPLHLEKIEEEAKCIIINVLVDRIKLLQWSDHVFGAL